MQEKINVYLSARISQDAHSWNTEVCSHLTAPFNVFLPHMHNPWNMKHEDLPREVYAMDLQAMKSSHMALLLPAYGRDCAWEAGWYANSNKPLVVFLDTQTEWLRDWMVKGGVDYVLTNNPITFRLLQEDPIVSNCSKLINDISCIHQEMLEIYERAYIRNENYAA